MSNRCGLRMRILFFLSFLFNANFVFSQTMDLVCIGDITVKTSDGKSLVLNNETRSYSFKNGKYGGVINATWSDNSILVKGPTEKENPRCFVFCNQSITINRLTGEVNEFYFSYIDKIKSNHWFKGNCTSAKKKF